MNQTTLSSFENNILRELKNINNNNDFIICDIVIADKIKKLNRGVGNEKG